LCRAGYAAHCNPRAPLGNYKPDLWGASRQIVFTSTAEIHACLKQALRSSSLQEGTHAYHFAASTVSLYVADALCGGSAESVTVITTEYVPGVVAFPPIVSEV
jgi:hypothetical protein